MQVPIRLMHRTITHGPFVLLWLSHNAFMVSIAHKDGNGIVVLTYFWTARNVRIDTADRAQKRGG
jgi:hypothetical protein